MEVIKNKKMLRLRIAAHKCQNKTIGLVPTMGYLHEGHISLIKSAQATNDIVVVSIFVNPLQFGANEDLDKYPRDIPADIAICENNQVDILFLPEPAEMLGNNLQLLTYVNIEQLDQNLCGAKRPGHFRGVCTIVSKLFNLVTPDKAYFGKKDIQQLRIIERMVADLDFPVQVIGVSTYRNHTGLALSSRNSYLSETQKESALIVPNTLKLIQQLVITGITDTQELIMQAKQFINTTRIADARLDYIEIVDNITLQKVAHIHQAVIIAIAVYIGKTRLIDNLIMGDYK